MLFFFLLLINALSYAQVDSLQARIVLIGDAGALHNGRHPVISAVKEKAKFDNKTTIIYLGDNLYSTGLPDESATSYSIARAVLDSQTSIAGKTGARVFFIPGNHDWDRAGPGGWNAILREQAYIESLGDRNVKFFPGDGCSGPVEVELSKDVVMVMFDSQWWIHPYDKPGIESDCPYKTKTEVLNQLEDILARNSDKLVILACHHPFKSYGVHGGYFTPKQHLFPLTEMWPKMYVPMPVIGSIYPIARGVFGTPQDTKHPAYANMIKEVQKVAKQHPNLIFVAGHEHNLQFIKDSSHNYIVSGSGTKKTRVSKNKKAPFTSAENGFALLEISKNRNVDLSFFTVTSDSVANPFRDHILNFAKLEKQVVDSNKIVSAPAPTNFKDSVEVVVNGRYDTASGFKRFILGNNYRKEWATPVRLKVFNISKEKGGFKIESLGGGKQTKSLKLTDKDGREWTLRTLNKDPEKAIPENLRGTLAQQIVQDMISTANPFAPITIAPLAKAIGVDAPSPEFFFVPDDPAFGIYRPMFSNTVCLLEEREPGSKPGETKSTAKVINKIIEDNDNHVDQASVLNARLLDMLVGDWDRHLDQWRFGTSDTGKGKLYYAIPRDRDQAFFNSDGLLVKQISNNLMPYLRGFKKNLKRINWLNWEGRDFDRLFMNSLNEEEWKRILANFKTNLTDDVITNAVKKLPPPIYAIRGENIIEKLKNRRDQLAATEGLKYYRFLSKEVNVVGSNKKEYFKVSNADGGGLHVKVYKRSNEKDSSSVMFDRVFKEGETEEIRLYGLNKDDIFDIDGNVNSKIEMRIIGGRGDDTFNVKGKMDNYIYDLSLEKNYITNPNRSRLKLSTDPAVNEYDVINHHYNIYRFPQLNIGFNAEDKLMVGMGFLRRTYGFRNEPYATQQKLSTLYAINHGSYQVKYNGEFNHALGNTDLVLNGIYVHPVLNNFFGLGNSTKNKMARDFYRVRYNYVEMEALLRRRPFNIVSVGIGPKLFHYWNRPDDNENKILAHPALVGLDSARVYSKKTYVGGKAFILINNLNSELLPTRGVYWNTELNSIYGVNKGSNNYGAITSDLTLYSSLSDPAKVVTVLRAGGGHIFSKDFEYFQALNLGQNNYLRGFRKNRFSGSGVAYGSIELRVKLFESKSYIIPGSIGLIGFEEVGRVWMKNEDSKKWHNSYGGGLYFTPYNLVIVSATVGFSQEETLFNLSIGTRFNLNF
jgi:hypothetical protein